MLSKCSDVEIREWVDATGANRKAFRCAFDEVNASKISVLTGEARTRYITLFGRTPEAEEAFLTECVTPNRVPNLDVMTFRCEVKPYCRVYSQATKNHQAGDLIIDDKTGKPKIYTTVSVDCECVTDSNKIAVPKNMAEVERIANNTRNWYINNDDKNGVRRYWEPEMVMDITPAEEEIHDEIPPEATTPVQTAPVQNNSRPNPPRPTLAH